MPLPPYPMINGRRPDWSSIRIKIKNKTYIGAKAANYKHTLEPGVVKGTSPQPIGHTLGDYSPEAGLEMYLEEWEQLRADLASGEGGYMATVFDVVIQYSVSANSPVITDELRGCRIKGVDKSHTQGNEPLAVKLDLFVMFILENGDKPIPGMLGV